MDYYDGKFAFFPNQLNSNSRPNYNCYLTSRLRRQVSAYSEVAGNPDPVPKSHYSVEGPFEPPMKVRRIDVPDVIYTGRIFRFRRK
jgi:hypothetical protein